MERALRIGYLMQNGAPDLHTISGPQLHVSAVVNGLRKRGHHVQTVACQRGSLQWSEDLQVWHPPQYGASRSQLARLVESGVRRIQSELTLPYLNFFDSVHYADACVQLLRGVDVLYERHGYLGYGGLLAARWLGVPLVLELNGNIVKEIDEMGVPMSPVQRAIGRRVTERSVRMASHVVTVSGALKDQVVHDYRLPASHVSVVLNGVDLALFSRPVDSEAVRRRYALGTDPLVVFVGTFQPWHGVEFLVSGFRTVIERFPTAKLLLAGDGPGRDAIATLIGGSGLSPHTTLTGRLTQPEVAEVVGAADVVVAPYGLRHTDVVGTPLKVVEYMAAGKAIVVSTAPIHELITDGVTGLRVAPAASEPLAEGITRLLGDSALRTRLGDAAQLEARRYSWDAVVSTLERLFEAQIAARQRVRPAAGRQS